MPRRGTSTRESRLSCSLFLSFGSAIAIVRKWSDKRERSKKRKVRVRAGAAAAVRATAYIYPTMQYLAASSGTREKDSGGRPHSSQLRSARMGAWTNSQSSGEQQLARLSFSVCLSLLFSFSLLSFSHIVSFFLSLSPCLRSFCFITMSGRVCVSVSLGSSCRCRRGWFLALCRVFISSE